LLSDAKDAAPFSRDHAQRAVFQPVSAANAVVVDLYDPALE
jgi:hypothetical protein